MTPFLALALVLLYVSGIWTMLLLLIQLERAEDPDADWTTRDRVIVGVCGLLWPLLSWYFAWSFVTDFRRHLREERRGISVGTEPEEDPL